MEITEAIKKRRSIYPKTYTGELIKDTIIEEILESASWAPSHRNTRPWRFIVFKDAGKKTLSDFQAEYYKSNTPPEQFKQNTYEKISSNTKMASHVIAICMKRDLKQSVPEIEEIESVACAVQNMHLTATKHQLGAYWSTGGVTYKKGAKNFFKLDQDDLLLGFFFVGVPSNPWPKSIERDWEQHVKWITD